MQYTKDFDFVQELIEHLLYIVCMLKQTNHLSISAELNFFLQYIIKLKANPDNPAFRCVFHPQFDDLYDKNKSCIKAIGLRIKKHLQDSNLRLDTIKPTTLSEIPPWKLKKPKVDISLSKF